ncbi:Calponin homology domain-containing protein [Toxocara canis]|uniref:Calponin homology domain-containing protein n=1 Tax=Toxocara canis TaxID=6265 RepID=A0A0B2UYZ2_TOXCA|nr:Calponin homology domain-containing protein [Toxocara canis]
MSRDDYDIRSEPRSRSTVRDVPVQRGAVTSLPPSSATTVEYRSSSTPFGSDNFQQQEYYRKEVMTRTYITRSTEALSAPPLSRSSPILVERERFPSIDRYYPSTREERTVDYNYKYMKNIEEEERRIRDEQEKRKAEEDERRRREEEERRLWEIREKEYYERMRRERERKHRELESERLERERLEMERLEKERAAREQAEMLRRAEWEKLERDRRALEERELEKRRALERERLERQRLEEERKERERIERERMERERERLEREKAEKERQERERIERERIEMERLEIERIERIKRERQERERIEREKEKEEEERRERERLEHERIAREKRELLRMEQELLEAQRREAEMREAERIEEENREARRREQERRDAELLAEMQRKAEEREAQRRLAERLEKERIENLRKEQERLELERQEADRRERQRMEEERREKELRDAQRRAAERREQERLEDERRERERQEAERKEAERRERERREAQRREHERQLEEEAEREKLAELERAAQERRAARLAEIQRDEQRLALERKAQEMKELERIEAERREKERLEEERHLAELREREKRNAELREKERREAVEREAARRREDRRSRDKLDQLAREIEEKEKMEAEKRRLLAQMDADSRRREMLTSRETLEKLTKAPYYSRENLAQPFGSRENLAEVTKVERQIIERVDRTYWADEPRQRSTSIDSPPDVGITSLKERIYHPRRTVDDDDFTRGSSRRTSRYRSKMEKARKDFLSADNSPTSDPLGERFQQTSEDIQRSRPEYRGPLLQKFHSGEFISKPNVDIQPYPRVGPSPYDQEYRRLMAKAQRNWAAYRQRMSQPNLYSKNRGWSTCYLETNLDTGVRDLASTHRQVEETNLDDVHRSGSVMDYSRKSRRDVTDGEVSHTRSKSADYLMDSKMREESAPPENELQKFGEKTPNISEHELRFRKSTEKLHVPDWYRERKSTKPTDLDASLDTNTSEPTTNYIAQSNTTYTTHYSSYATRFEPSSLNQGQSSYASDRYRYDSEPEPIIQTPGSDSVSLPHGMFDKYKDEIEEMRRSRSSLHQLAIDDRKADEDIITAAHPSEVEGAATVEKTSFISSSSGRQLPGYTVTDVPSDWNVPGDRHSRVIEVADTFVGPKGKQGGSTVRYGGRVTIEEVLDSIFQQTTPSTAATSYYADSRRLMAKAQRNWAAYRQRMSQPNLYSKNRGWSTCYLETNLDTGVRDLASTHRQVEETNLDDVHRSGSVMDYSRKSRRDVTDGEVSHTRSKSADYLMDSKMREESAPPENELQKFGEKTPNISEHELRFRKSTEKLHVPDWYRERKSTKPTDLDASLDTNTSEPTTNYIAQSNTTYTTHYSSYATRFEPSSLNQGQSSYASDRYRYDSEPEPIIQTPGSDSVSLPHGMFDKYKDEIEEMRRSRSSLHQLAIDDRKADEDIITAAHPSEVEGAATVEKTSFISSSSGRQLPGYTVTDVPSDWNVPGDRHSRVIEVADTFVGPKGKQGGSTVRYGGRVTIEEVLDSIFQQTTPSTAATSYYADSR